MSAPAGAPCNLRAMPGRSGVQNVSAGFGMSLLAGRAAPWRPAAHPPLRAQRRARGSALEHASAAGRGLSTARGAAAADLASSGNSNAAAGPSGREGSYAEVVGVVIVDHGSRKKESNDMLHEFAELYRQVSGRQVVEPAHMELAEPTIEQAVARCVSRGAQRVIVAPYFLSRGRHIQEDIPALVAAAQQQHPSVECVVADPIGIDALMAQLIEQRVRSAAGVQPPAAGH